MFKTRKRETAEGTPAQLMRLLCAFTRRLRITVPDQANVMVHRCLAVLVYHGEASPYDTIAAASGN